MLFRLILPITLTFIICSCGGGGTSNSVDQTSSPPTTSPPESTVTPPPSTILPSKGSIRGTVLDSNGNVVRGATVQLGGTLTQNEDGSIDSIDGKTVVTDNNGEYEIIDFEIEPEQTSVNLYVLKDDFKLVALEITPLDQSGADSSSSFDETFSIVYPDITMDHIPKIEVASNVSGTAGENVFIDSSASNVLDGGAIYEWLLIKAPFGANPVIESNSTAQLVFNTDISGQYEFSFTIKDIDGDSTTEIVNVDIALDTTPTVVIQKYMQVLVGAEVVLDASGSFDQDGDEIFFNWANYDSDFPPTLPPGTPPRPDGFGILSLDPELFDWQSRTATLDDYDSAKPSFIANERGEYTFALVVTDGKTNSGLVIIEIDVVAENTAPNADSGEDQTVSLGSIVNLDGSLSSDSDNDPLTYQWSFVSVPNGSNAIISNNFQRAASFTPDKEGTYIISLTVDDGVATQSDNIVVSVTNEPELRLSRSDSFGFGNSRLPLPYSLDGVSNVTIIGSSTVTLGTYMLEAVGRDFVILNVSATDSTNSVRPFFTGLSSNQRISKGQKVTFKLESPLTGGATANLKYSFSVAGSGDTFEVKYRFRSN